MAKCKIDIQRNRDEAEKKIVTIPIFSMLACHPEESKNCEDATACLKSKVLAYQPRVRRLLSSDDDAITPEMIQKSGHQGK